MESIEPAPGARDWPLLGQYALALGLALAALLAQEVLQPVLGDRLPLLPLLVVLAALTLLVRPGPFLVGAGVAGAGGVWQLSTALAPEEWLGLTGLLLLLTAGMAWALARLLRCQRQLEDAAAEERELLKVTLAQVSDGVVRTDAAGRVDYMNPAACRATGWPLQDARGQRLPQVLRIVDERSREAAPEPGQAPPREGAEPAPERPLLLLARDGSECPVEQAGAPLRDADGQPRGGVHVFHDVSERRRAALEREQAARRKDEFLAALAHELRNPLAPAVNALQILDEPSAAGPVHDQARQILRRQLRQLVRLIDDLMDVSRITHDRLVLQRAPVALQQVVRRAVEASRYQIERAGQVLDLRLDDAPIGLRADAARLEQIVCNLLDNASKYSPAGSRVSLSVQRRDGEAELSVRDRGIGIDAETLPRLFEMFAQDESGHGAAAGGLGIGLALSRRLAELHGGSLQAYSGGPGQGSEFVLRLPVDAPLSAALASDSPQRAPGERTDGASGASCRVLIVDDNEDAAESLSELLRLNGHDTRTAYDGRDVLVLAQLFRPHALLLDIGLPGLSGLEVARQLRAQAWGTGVLLVAVTGWGQESDRLASAEAGFDAHLVKPLDPQAVLRLLAGLPCAAAGTGIA